MKFLGFQFLFFVLLCATLVMSQCTGDNASANVACGAYRRGRRLPRPQGGQGGGGAGAGGAGADGAGAGGAGAGGAGAGNAAGGQSTNAPTV